MLRIRPRYAHACGSMDVPGKKRRDSVVTPLIVIDPHRAFVARVNEGGITDEHGDVMQLYDMDSVPLGEGCKRKDTFCVSVALAVYGDARRAPDVRREILMSFARIMFGDTAGNLEDVEHVLLAQDALRLDDACARHPAIQQWVLRLHMGNPMLHKRVEDWLMVYPGTLKTNALLFLRHNSKRGAGRVLCKFTFAFLSAGLYGRKILFYQTMSPLNALPHVAKSAWVFSKEALDDEEDVYEEDVVYTRTEYAMKFTPSIIMYHGNKQFNLLLTAKRARELAAMDGAIYVLRKFQMVETDARNQVVGGFARVAPGSGVFIMRFADASEDPREDTIYLVYPNHEVTGSTALSIPEGCAMFVFYIGKRQQRVTYSGHFTDTADMPSHFKLRADSGGVMVVNAQCIEDARRMIVTETGMRFADDDDCNA